MKNLAKALHKHGVSVTRAEKVTQRMMSPENNVNLDFLLHQFTEQGLAYIPQKI